MTISPSIGATLLSSNAIVQPTLTTTYTLTANGVAGSTSEQLTLTVIQPPSLEVSGPIVVPYGQETINFSYEGSVVVNVLVNTQGRVADVTVVKSSGYTILDEAFIATIKSSYIFKPKRLNGVNLSDSVTLSYTFSL